MKVDVQGEGLTTTQAHAMVTTIRTSFGEFAQRITSVMVVVSTQAEKRHATRRCMIEVRMADGRVEHVEERQRRLGSALRRAVQRAWKAAVSWLRQQRPARPASPSHQALSLVPVSILSSNNARRGER
jgi:hypothetical protein